MESEKYQKRFYRAWQNPYDLVGFRVKYKESDISIYAEKDLTEIALPLLIDCRRPIEKTIESYPLFESSLEPIQTESKYPIIKEMIKEATIANVGPMAGVAGAIAQCLGKSLLNYSGEILIENGGDLFIKSNKDRILMVYTGEDSPFRNKLKIKLKAKNEPYGVCTSSKTIGHSINLGNTDVTVILSISPITADVFATAISNMVKTQGDIEKAVEYGMGFDRILGGLIVIGDKVSAWGKVEFV